MVRGSARTGLIFLALAACAGAAQPSRILPPEERPMMAGLWRVTPTSPAAPVRQVCLTAPVTPDIGLAAWPHPAPCPMTYWSLYREAFWIGLADACQGPAERNFDVAVDIEGDLARRFQLRINLAPLPLKRSAVDDRMSWYEAERLGDCP